MHYRLVANTAFSKSKHGFIFLAGNYVGTNDQFEVTNYSWISILSKSYFILRHMDLSLTKFMIINSRNKRVVTFLTGLLSQDSDLHLSMNLCSGVNADSLDL